MPASLERLPAWVDRKVLPALVIILIVTNVLVAANWIASPEASLTSPAYAVAKGLTTMTNHALILGLATLAATATIAVKGRSWIGGYGLCLVGGVWTAWTVLFALAPMGRPGASYLGAILAAAFAALHLVAGLAFSHKPSRR